VKRRAPKSIPETSRLSRDSIVDEGVRLLGEEGLDGVSLRNLAGRLGVRAPSLYWHVPDKNALLAAMMERIFTGCIESVPAKSHWRDWMLEFGAAMWRTQAATRDFVRLFTTSPMGDEQVQRTNALIAERVSVLDIPPKESMRIQGSVQVLITGWSIFAHTRFAPALHMDFHARALRDLKLLLEGEAMHLPKAHGRAARPRKVKTSAR
jgi:TetR/AcrR family tetracycline transcriptional repressor